MTNPGPPVFPANNNPDGTPNFPSGASGGGAAPTINIWNLPRGLDPHKRIWFDVGHKTTKTVTGSTRLSPDFGVKSDGSQGKEVKKTTAYDIFRNPRQVMQQFAAMSMNNPDMFLALQKALASGPWGTVHASGAFDADTESALGHALLQYAKVASTGVAMSFTQYLLETGQRNQSLGGDGTSLGSGGHQAPAPPQINLADPETIRAAAQQAAQQALGMGLSPDQLDQFVSQFQAAQTAAQTQAQTATTGPNITTQPDLSTEAMQFAQGEDPKAYHANQKQAFLDTLVNMFAPPGSQRPSMTPTPKA